MIKPEIHVHNHIESPKENQEDKAKILKKEKEAEDLTNAAAIFTVLMLLFGMLSIN
jgi:hypothetical protein